MKNSMRLVIPLLGLLVVSGCWNKKDKSTANDKKATKKAALIDKGGIPLGSSLKDQDKFFDSGVEAYVLEDENFDEEMRLAQLDDEQPGDAPVRTVAHNGQQSFEPIFFNFDSEEIRADQRPALAYDIEEAKKAAQESVLVVAGHSDSHFVSEMYNIAKSEKRARRVAQELKEAGVPEERVKVVAYGDRQKLVDTPGKEEKNRRAQIIKLQPLRL